MYIFLLCYIMPAILNVIIFGMEITSLEDIYYEHSSILSYVALCFLPVLNLLVCFYLILFYVHKIFRKD